MSDAGLEAQIKAGIQDGLQTAHDVAGPIFDVAGNVLGWIATQAAPIIGTENAIAVTDAVGNTIGTINTAMTGAVASAYQAEGTALVAAYDSAGNLVGHMVKTVATAVAPAISAVLKFLVLGVVALIVAQEVFGGDDNG